MSRVLKTLLLLTLAVGTTWVFALQTKLPYKKMSIATDAMIVGVLFMMMGNTAHTLQFVGWLPVHSISGLNIYTWMSLWLGICTTWEGLFLQILGPTLIVGSYFLAQVVKSSKTRRKTASA